MQMWGKGQEEHVHNYIWRFLELELAGCLWNLDEPSLPPNGVDARDKLLFEIIKKVKFIQPFYLDLLVILHWFREGLKKTHIFIYIL